MTSKIKVDNINKVSDDSNIIKKCGSTITVGAGSDATTVAGTGAVTVGGNVVKSNALQASDAGNIISQSGTTITLGAAGDTVALAACASQTGFGATYSAISWDTSAIKTTGFTATAGNGYFCNTTGGSFTVTLPASPSAGDMVGIKDYANTFDTSPITVGRNSKKIESESMDAKLQVEGDAAIFIFMDDTVGWKVVDHAKKADVAFPTYITATGGNCVSTSGNYKIHKFTGPGTFCVSAVGNPAGSTAVCYMIVAGGGGATGNPGNNAGGGGGGGFRASAGDCAGDYLASPSPLAPTLTNPVSSHPLVASGAGAYPITVGGGGSAPGSGSPAVAFCVTSAGGGAGANWPSSGSAGGSGGGSLGTGNSPPVSPPQGNNGGNSPGGGGGGMGWAGGAYGSGGGGVQSCITASPVYYAGGSQGGGARWSPPWAPTPSGKSGIGNAGAANTGQGGSAGSGPPAPSSSGSAGGSGIVVIRYRYQ